MTKDKPQCTCKAVHGDDRDCPWHGVEAMREYRKRHPPSYPGDYE